MPPRGRAAPNDSVPIEAISRRDGSIWKIKLLHPISERRFYVRWIVNGVVDSSVFDQEMGIEDMRPESRGCSHEDCDKGRLREGVQVVAFITPPQEHRKDPTVVSKVIFVLFDHLQGLIHMGFWFLTIPGCGLVGMWLSV